MAQPKQSKDSPTERPVGRPRGRTAQGEETRALLYQTALALITERGYEAATLREVAARAGVSVGLLYKYFANKSAIVLALYEELSVEYAARASLMEAGLWRQRFLFALRTSLEVLRPHRAALFALTPVLVSGEESLFSQLTAFSRERVMGAFLRAVREADDAGEVPQQEALGRLLYLAHLGVILWWLLDKSPGQRATERLLLRVEGAAPMLDLLLGFPFVSDALEEVDLLSRAALFGEDC